MITVRSATVADAVQLAELGHTSFADAFAADNDPTRMADYVKEAFSVSRLEEELTDRNARFLVAETEQALVGYAKVVRGEAPDCQTDIVMEVSMAA